jgi:prepilin signal peptidase PulO-like enzyme (type II secretory pathway)
MFVLLIALKGYSNYDFIMDLNILNIYHGFGYLGLFVLGLFIGSFLNVVADRSSKGLSFLKGRSKCDDCDKALGVKDLVPLFSYMFLKGKCRYCSTKLSAYYPLSELLTGLLFAGLAYYIGVFNYTDHSVWFSYVYLTSVFSAMVVLLLADLKYRLLPNNVIYPTTVFVILMTTIAFAFLAYSSYKAMNAEPFGQYLIKVGYWRDQMYLVARSIGLTFLSAFALAMFFWLLILITKGKGMGGGDLKLAFLIGLFNGFPGNVVAIVLAFVLGAAYSLVLVVLRRKSMKDTIPFGPFLILGSVLAFVFGRTLLSFYTQYF